MCLCEREREIKRKRAFIKLHINRGALHSIADAIKFPLVHSIQLLLSLIFFLSPSRHNRLHAKRQRVFLKSTHNVNDGHVRGVIFCE